MSAKESLSVIILAGGQSVRMGQDKAAIEINHIPLIRRIYDVVADCEIDSTNLANNIYVVSPWAERYRSMLPISCQFIDEHQPHQGPLLGFAQSLSHINSTWALLLACDLPNLSIPVIQDWIAQLADISPQSIAYLPRNFDKGWEPLCGFYRRSCLDSLLTYISAGGKSFQGWLSVSNVTELAIADRQLLLNCNTPAELTKVIRDRSLFDPNSVGTKEIK